jgi:methionyl-tRNA synthetase
LFTALEPWKSTTNDTDLLNAMVFAHEALRLTGIALSPIMPSKTKELLDSLKAEARTWEHLVWDEQGALGRVVNSVTAAASEGKGKKQVLFPALIEETI